MAKQAKEAVPAKARSATRRTKQRELNDQEEEILRRATMELITHHGGHFVATALRETTIKGFPLWIITVTMRYDKGDEAYIGDMLYDGEQFTFLTAQSVIDEQAQKFADDPERIRKWNAYRASPLPTGKA